MTNMKNKVLFVSCLFAFSTVVQAQQIEKVFPGIWKITYGQPEKQLPTEFKKAAAEDALQTLTDDAPDEPFALKSIRFRQTPRGAVAGFEIGESEKIYGFGLQSNTFQQRGLRREIRCNDNVIGDIGFGHASLPFFISSKGYGVLVNTARYTTFYMTSQRKLNPSDSGNPSANEEDRASAVSPEELYNRLMTAPPNEVEMVVDNAQGMEIYVFAGPSVREVVRRYNLFSGGGAIPPIWGMGLKYRAKNTFNDQQVLAFMKYFRDNHIPCDMFGLEPGWHTAAYSCSYVWNPKNFPNPDSLLNVVHEMNYKLNLWEHAYVHPTSPIFRDMVPYSGDYTVWKGAVPDFTLPEARKIFSDYHEENFLKKGVAGFKLDECDNSFQNAASELTFPDISQFPSGIDGVQYRQLLGLLYQKTIEDMYRRNNLRTYTDVRASHLFATPYSASIYTDMYAHEDYVRMILNAGFSGLNYSPEVRDTNSDEDLIRRLQTTLMSPQMLVDCWFLSNPPWFQYNTEKNNRNEFLPHYRELEQKSKKLIELRMTLIPYLYSAFAKYHFEGIPPFRSLILDYPDEEAVWEIEDQYMMGDHLMCAPFLNGASTRNVYFPSGVWYDFNTGKTYEGGRTHEISMTLDEIPVFVKDGTILPLAKPVQYITPETVFDVTCHVYGNPNRSAYLFEDDGYTFDFEKGAFNWIELSWHKNKGKTVAKGGNKKQLYKITSWTAH
jgi:alpha-D-xyloside xylohydrolase